MATILQQPPQLCFSSDIPDIIFSCADESAELTVSLVMGKERVELLSETVYPDLGHEVSVVDVPSLVELYAREHLMLTLECGLKDSEGVTAIGAVTVFYAMADVGESAGDFLTTHFLTVLDGEKLTAMGREERLYAYGANELTVMVKVPVMNGIPLTLQKTLPAVVTKDGVSQFDVSPRTVRSLFGRELTRYYCVAGERWQEFSLVEDESAPAPSLVFVNSFGCQEFIHCTGLHQKDSKYDRQTTRIRGRRKNYSIVEDRQFKASTGWLNQSMADWADELFRSYEVHLWVNGRMDREVVITDSKSEISNADDDMPSFEFTYGYAQRIHNVRQPENAGRVFDNTFDYTFE